VLETGVALQGRGLSMKEKKELATGSFKLGERDLTAYLENWTPLEKIRTP